VQALFWGDLNVIAFIINLLKIILLFKIGKINAENCDDIRILLRFVEEIQDKNG